MKAKFARQFRVIVAQVLVLVASLALIHHVIRPVLVTDAQVQLGIVQPESIVSVKLVIENTGRLLPLKLYDIASDCGCTVLDRKALTVEAGHKAEIPVRIAIPGGDRPHTFRVMYRTNDRYHPVGRTEIKAVSEYGVQLAPQRLLLMPGYEFTGDPPVIQALVSANRPSLKLFRATTLVDYLDIDARILSDREAAIRVTPKQPFINGEFKAMIFVEYQLAGEPLGKTHALVCGMLKEDIKAEPPIVQIRLTDARSREVSIDGNFSSKPELTLTDFSEMSLHAELLKNGKLLVKVDESLAKPDAGSIMLKWQDRNQRLSIPVTISK